MSVTATYSYPSAVQRAWFGLAEVNGTLYAATGEGIYSVNKSTGAITVIYSEWRDWRVMSTVNGNLLCSQYNGALKLISPAGVLLKNFGNDLWFGACADSSDTNVAYGACFNKSTNQFAKLNISAGTVQYYTVANRSYCGIVNIGQYLYAVVNNGLIYKIDKTTFAETVFCNESRAWIDLTTDGTYLYSVVHGGQVRRIDLATGVSEIILGDPAGNTTNRDWQTLTYSSTDKAIWAGIYNWELWKLALPIPAVPTASVPTSTIYNDTLVTLSCSTSGATIKYTTNGTTPGLSNGTTYSGAITISQTTTLKFCAIKDNLVTAGTDATYTYVCLDPSISLANGTFNNSQNVTLSTSSSTASIKYTTNGSTPSASNGTLYSGTITLNGSVTSFKAIAYKANCTSSAVISRTYAWVCSDPTNSLASGTFNNAQTATLACSTSGATIKYTTDGSTPSTVNGTTYTVAVNLDGYVTSFKAIATKTGYTSSSVISRTYAWVCLDPTISWTPQGYGDFLVPNVVSGTWVNPSAQSASQLYYDAYRNRIAVKSGLTLYRSVVAGNAFSSVGSLPSNYTLLGISSAGVYYYYDATNEALVSSSTGIAPFTTVYDNALIANIRGVAFDSNNSSHIYFWGTYGSTYVIMKSIDSGANWTTVYSNTTRVVSDVEVVGSTLYAITYIPTEANLLLISTAIGSTDWVDVATLSTIAPSFNANYIRTAILKDSVVWKYHTENAQRLSLLTGVVSTFEFPTNAPTQAPHCITKCDTNFFVGGSTGIHYAPSSSRSYTTQQVTLTPSGTIGVTNKYSTDGSTPTTVFSGVTVIYVDGAGNVVVKAVASKGGYSDSGTATITIPNLSNGVKYVYHGSAWQSPTKAYVMSTSTWKQATAIYKRISGIWTRIL